MTVPADMRVCVCVQECHASADSVHEIDPACQVYGSILHDFHLVHRLGMKE